MRACVRACVCGNGRKIIKNESERASERRNKQTHTENIKCINVANTRHKTSAHMNRYEAFYSGLLAPAPDYGLGLG